MLDGGSHSIRAGFAGDDTPRSIIPTSYAVTDDGDKKFGDGIHVPRPGVRIENPYNADGVVQDWETASKLWEYGITSRLTGGRPTPPSKNGLNDDKDANGDTNMDERAEQAEEQERVLGEYPLLMTVRTCYSG